MLTSAFGGIKANLNCLNEPKARQVTNKVDRAATATSRIPLRQKFVQPLFLRQYETQIPLFKIDLHPNAASTGIKRRV